MKDAARWALAALMITTGCGADGSSDAGPVADAGPMADAGSVPDAGGGPDAGDLADGGTATDAGPSGGLPALGDLISEVISNENPVGASDIRLGSDGTPRAFVGGDLWVRSGSGDWTEVVDTIGAQDGATMRLGADDRVYAPVTGPDPAVAVYDGSGWTRMSFGLPAATFSAVRMDLALDASDRPAVLWHDSVAKELHVTVFDGSAFTDEVVESPSAAGDEVGTDGRIAIDADGAIHVVYNVETATVIELHYATNASGSWLIESIPVVTQSAMVLDSEGQPRVVGTRDDAEVFYVRRSGSAWTETLLETWPRVRSLDIAVDAADRAHIVYTARSGAQLTYRRETDPAEFDSHRLGTSSTIPDVGLVLDATGLPHVVATFTGVSDADVRYLHY